MAYMITIDGRKIELPDTKLETLQKAVDGYIEIINLGKKVMIVNEEGMLLHLPVNEMATLLLQAVSRFPVNPVLGNVVIADKSEID